jgi:hypothetical protein
MLTLLWGLGSEGPLAAVLEELESLGAPTALIDQRMVLDTEIELDIAEKVRGIVRAGSEVIDLSQVTACYLRPYDWQELAAIGCEEPGSPIWQHAAAFHDALCCWSELTPGLVVNRLAAMAANGSKPFQLSQIRRLGFAVPETIVTTDPDAAKAFWQRHGSVVYKSVSAVRSRVSRLNSEHLERLADVASCPTQFQRYIAGTDYRVHIVGNEVFACEVRSDVDDYRYPGSHTVTITACEIPAEVKQRCRRMAAAMQLVVAGIDLRRSPDGTWYCFEVNPSPGFTYYENTTGLPIAGAIARLLAAGLEGLSGAASSSPNRSSTRFLTLQTTQ